MDFIRRRVFRKINAYLVLAAFGAAVALAVSLGGPAADEDHPGAPAEPVTGEYAPAEKPFSHYGVITEKNLFGLPEAAAPEKAPPPVERPAAPAMPSLELIGTVVLSSGAGYAVIRDKGSNSEEVVARGGAISGMELVSLGWDRAVLKGEAGELSLEIDPEAVAEPSRTPPRAPAAGRTDPRDTSSRAARRRPSGATGGGPPSWVADEGPPPSRPGDVPPGSAVPPGGENGSYYGP